MYLADSLHLRVFGDSMVVELLGLAAKLWVSSANEAEQALVHGLDIALVGQIPRGAMTRLEVGRIKFSVESMEDVGENDAIRELFKGLGRAVEVKDVIDL